MPRSSLSLSVICNPVSFNKQNRNTPENGFAVSSIVIVGGSGELIPGGGKTVQLNNELRLSLSQGMIVSFSIDRILHVL